MFSPSEYLRLAAHASTRGERYAALGFLREALAAEPRNAMGNYMLAAECAELGLYERAIRGLEETLAVEPKMDVARLQLCLLYWQTGQLVHTRTHVAVLREQGTAEVKCYADALAALAASDMEKARERLTAGLRIAGDNAALTRSMYKVFEHLLSLPPATATRVAQASRSATSTRLPGAYEQVSAGDP